MQRGEVRWYKFKAPDKQRPVVILTRDSIIPYLNELTVAPITTTIRTIPSEVMLLQSDGLPHDCAVNCDHLQTVSKTKVGKAITILSEEKMREVARAISFSLDLDWATQQQHAADGASRRR